MQEEALAQKVKGFQVLYDKRVKGFKKTWYKMSGRKLLKKLDFVQNSNFIWRSTEVNSQENTCGRFYFGKVAELKCWSLLQ